MIPIDFVCDHALIAEYGGRPDAMALNERIEVRAIESDLNFLNGAQGPFQISG